MDKELVPFWEEAYQNENITAFSIEPNATIKEFEHLLSIGIIGHFTTQLIFNSLVILDMTQLRGDIN